MALPVILLGAGGHARVLVSTLLELSVEIIGCVSVRPGESAKDVLGVPIIGDDDVVLKYPPPSLLLVNALGSVGCAEGRRKLFEKFKSRGYSFASVIHPSVLLGKGVVLDEGAQLMAGAVVQAGCRIGRNAILNTGAVLDHDCRIGAHVHVAPGAVLSGGVVIEDCAHVGAGATVIQCVTIGAGSIVGAGAVVLRPVPAGATVVGVPARRISVASL